MKTSYNHCGNYEITISVKRDGKGGKQETQAFLNMMLCFIGEARNYYQRMNLNALSKEASDVYEGIRTTLVEQHYYDDVR